MKKSIIGLKELRENMEIYIEQVKKGKSFTVVRKSRPVFNISAVEDDEDLWEEVIDFTKIKKGGVVAQDILKAIKNIDG